FSILHSQFFILHSSFFILIMVHSTFSIRVPASTANLGPAFDTLGLALGLYLSLRGTWHEEIGDWKLTATGNAATHIPLRSEENLICQVARHTAATRGVSLPALSLEIINDVPLGSGLGSSAAAIVAGVSLVESFLGQEFSIDEFLSHAMVFESHADNLAPARLGGLILLCDRESGAPYLIQKSWPDEISVLVVRPHFPLSTQTMRTVLPDSLPRADVVFQMQHLGLLLAALDEKRFDLLRDAMQDRLHQNFRARHIPGLEDILNLSHPGLLATALSGAGPSALALALSHQEEIATQMQACFARSGHQSTAYFLDVDLVGRKLEWI
ncbi:MAG TPA: homoserine kinase, partial [Acidobacteriota bacterium]|nr:homoserine kinase [Acidobacteriota bacterium]